MRLMCKILLGNSISHNNDNSARKESQLIMTAFIAMSFSQVGDHLNIKLTECTSYRQGC